MESENENCLDELVQYAKQTYGDELLSDFLKEDGHRHFSVMIDTMSMLESNVTFSHLLFDGPDKALKILDQAFNKAALGLITEKGLSPDILTRKTIHVRLQALPNLPEIHRPDFPHCSEVGQFLCISGTVIRATSLKILEYRKHWKCKKCKYPFVVEAVLEKKYVMEKPSVCPNPDWCNGRNFTLLNPDVQPENCKDYREIKIQQRFNCSTVGSVPKSIWVVLEDDLVDVCHPGNSVTVSGILIQRWAPLKRGNFIDIDLVLLAHNVEVKNNLSVGVISDRLALEFGKFWMEHKSNPLQGRDVILSSVCPQVFGLYVVKLAVALILAGGVEKKDANSRIRGDSHILLVGDPGTGKSQFLRYASKVCLRSVMTSGTGTSNAGLTVSAVKEDSKWQLEAGALVLADGGLCCIDEFSCIKEQDKTCIHEAMEQQTISVAKAGLVCSLSTKCSILAATNPRGKYDKSKNLSENTLLASPLLSRFDVILVLLDSADETWDRMITSYILDGRDFVDSSTSDLWDLSKMRSYIGVIRRLNPKMTSTCYRILQSYYSKQRNSEDRVSARTTPRLLQSLIRLAEGHARLMFRKEVLVVDAIVAIMLMDSSMSNSSILKDMSSVRTSFPVDPDGEYEDKAKSILELLHLEEFLPEVMNFKHPYQNINVESLLLDVSAPCRKTTSVILNDNSDLKDNANRTKHTTPVKYDDFLSNLLSEEDKNIASTQNRPQPRTVANSKNENALVSQSFKKPPDFKTKLDRLPSDRTAATPGKNSEIVAGGDQITSLSALEDVFSDDFLVSADTTPAFFKNMLKRKRANSPKNHSSKAVRVTDELGRHSSLSDAVPDDSAPTSNSEEFEVDNELQAENACPGRPSTSGFLRKFTFQKLGKNGGSKEKSAKFPFVESNPKEETLGPPPSKNFNALRSKNAFDEGNDLAFEIPGEQSLGEIFVPRSNNIKSMQCQSSSKNDEVSVRNAQIDESKFTRDKSFDLDCGYAVDRGTSTAKPIRFQSSTRDDHLTRKIKQSDASKSEFEENFDSSFGNFNSKRNVVERLKRTNHVPSCTKDGTPTRSKKPSHNSNPPLEANDGHGTDARWGLRGVNPRSSNENASKKSGTKRQSHALKIPEATTSSEGADMPKHPKATRPEQGSAVLNATSAQNGLLIPSTPSGGNSKSAPYTKAFTFKKFYFKPKPVVEDSDVTSDVTPPTGDSVAPGGCQERTEGDTTPGQSSTQTDTTGVELSDRSSIRSSQAAFKRVFSRFVKTTDVDNLDIDFW